MSLWDRVGQDGTTLNPGTLITVAPRSAIMQVVAAATDPTCDISTTVIPAIQAHSGTSRHIQAYSGIFRHILLALWAVQSGLKGVLHSIVLTLHNCLPCSGALPSALVCLIFFSVSLIFLGNSASQSLTAAS